MKPTFKKGVAPVFGEKGTKADPADAAEEKFVGKRPFKGKAKAKKGCKCKPGEKCKC